MATNKTIAPTGVTVQIPGLTDAPDMSVPANAIDKAIDGINALNSQIVPMQKKTATATTSATGSINLSTAFSVYAGAYSLVNLYAESSEYPNGLIAKEVKLGTSYYAIITDTTGAVVASKSVNLSAIVANIGFA